MNQRVESQNAILLRQWFDEVWNQKSESSLQNLMAEDVLAYGVEDAPVGRDGFRRGWQTFLETFPDIHVSVDDVVTEGHKTAARLTVTGTHLGHGLGIDPTGKKVSFQAHTLAHWKGGKIVAGWNVIDMASVYRQVGA